MKKFNVTANHPTFKRIDKFNISKIEKDNLLKELKAYGYENIKVEERK